MREVVPGIPVRAVIFANRPPSPLAEIRSPALPIHFAIFILDQAFVFFAHEKAAVNQHLAISNEPKLYHLSDEKWFALLQDKCLGLGCRSAASHAVVALNFACALNLSD